MNRTYQLPGNEPPRRNFRRSRLRLLDETLSAVAALRNARLRADRADGAERYAFAASLVQELFEDADTSTADRELAASYRSVLLHLANGFAAGSAASFATAERILHALRATCFESPRFGPHSTTS